MTDDVQYEFKSVKTIRGMDARTIAKWEGQGWELDANTPGTVRNELTFRRVKRKLPRKGALVALGGLAAFAVIGLSIGLTVGDDDPESAAPPVKASATTTPGKSEAPTPEETADAPTPSKPEPVGPLTAANNADVAAVLKAEDSCDESISAFAARYEGQSIRFDGVITNMAPHGDAQTRYDILISPGNEVEATKGPSFKYEDVNTVNDLGWRGSDVPDAVGEGSKLRFTAEIGDYNKEQCLFFLDRSPPERYKIGPPASVGLLCRPV